jgi:hypothetical protein
LVRTVGPADVRIRVAQVFGGQELPLPFDDITTDRRAPEGGQVLVAA